MKTTQGTTPIKVILDLFTGEVPFVQAASGVRVVEPRHLLSPYGVKHSSDQCFAVQIAKRLVAAGISPNGQAKVAHFIEFLGQEYAALKEKTDAHHT